MRLQDVGRAELGAQSYASYSAFYPAGSPAPAYTISLDGVRLAPTAERLATYIFDEVDAGIGGATATAAASCGAWTWQPAKQPPPPFSSPSAPGTGSPG